MSMHRMRRIVLLTIFIAIAPVLAGCADFDLDKLDVFGLNEKKKLAGDRRPLFPEGVPGVTQGIPPEFVKGNQPPPDAALPVEPAAETQKQTAAAPAQEPKPQAKPKPKPKQTVKRPPKPPAPAANAAAPAAQQAPAWPAPDQQPAQAQSPSAWPAQQGQSSSTAPWPSAPPPGTFTR